MRKIIVMEKDDKIQHLRAQARKKAAMWLFVLIAAAAILSVAVDVIDKTAAESSMSGTGIDDDDSVDHDNSILQQNQNVRVGNGNGVGDAIIPDAKAAEASVNDRSIRLEALEREYRQLDQQVRAIKATGVIMETDPESLKVTSELQNVARRLLVAKYGKHESYRVRVDLEFPPTIPDYNTHPSGKYGTLVIEMAPIDLIPVSVYTFLEVARTFVSGAFHRNAGHVLQVKVRSKEIKQHLPFQEYSKEFPHKKGTTGYCGRPSGPCWYVSIRDNTRNHVSFSLSLSMVYIYAGVCLAENGIHPT